MKIVSIVVGIALSLLVAAYLLPIGIPNLVTSSEEAGPKTQSFTIPTVLPTLTVIPITPLASIPVIANSQTLTVDRVAQTETTHYTFVDATGVATINTDRIDSGSVVRVTYSFETPATIAALYALIAIIVFLVVVMAYVKYVKNED